MSDEKFDESKRIKVHTGWEKFRGRGIAFGIALGMAAGAVALGHVNSIAAERVAVYCLVAWMAGRPVVWANRHIHKTLSAKQAAEESAGDVDGFNATRAGYLLLTLPLLAFSLLFWVPLRWGIVYATALGWL